MPDQKKLNKRLSDLFTDLENELSHLPDDESLTGWTWACDMQGVYFACNSDVEEILGFATHEIIGQPVATFGVAPGSQGMILASLETKQSPIEINLQFIGKDNTPVSARMTIFKSLAEDGNQNGWHGFSQVIHDVQAPTSILETPKTPDALPPGSDSTSISSLSTTEGVAIEDDQYFSVSTPYSSIGRQSLELRQTLSHGQSPDLPAELAVPIDLQQQALGLIEFIDENPDRQWSLDEQRLVEEVAGQLSLALENARLFEAEQIRSQELALINRIVSKVAASLDLNESLQIITTELGEALNVQTGFALLNRMGDTLKVVSDYNPDPRFPPSIGMEIPVEGNPSSEKAISTKKPVIIQEAQTDPLTEPVHETMQELGIFGLAIYPLIILDEVAGTLGLGIQDQARSFTQDELQIVETSIAQASTAIQNARLFSQVQARSTQLQTAAEISRAASSILEPNPLILQAVNLIRDRFDLYYVGIFLKDVEGVWTGEADKWAVLRAGTGEAGRIQVEQGHKLEVGGTSMIGQCIAHSEAKISLLAVDETQRFVNPHLPDTQSEMALPLISRGRVIGAMTIQSTQPGAFTEEDISVLQTMADQVANALQNANLFDQTQARAQELVILNEMSRVLTDLREVDQIIESVFTYTSQLMDTAIFFMALYDEETDEISVPLASINGERVDSPSRKLGHGLTDYVIRTGDDLLIEENIPQTMEELGLEFIPLGEGRTPLSWMGVPLTIGDRRIGVISVQSITTPRLYNEHHRDLLISIASQTAISLQNANLFEQTQIRAEELTILNEMSLTLSGQLDLDDIIQTIYRFTSRLMPTEYFFVALYEDDENLISFPLVVENNEVGTIPAMRKSKGLTQHVIDTKEPLLIYENVEQVIADLGLEHIVVGEPAQSWLGVPLLIGDKVLGVITVQNASRPRTFSHHDQDLLLAVARQSAIAIQNANLFAQSEEALAETEALFDITSLASQSLQLKEMLDKVLAEIIEIAGFQCGLFSIYNANTHQLEMITQQGLPDPMYESLLENGLEDTLCDLVYRKKETISLNDLSTDAPIDVSGIVEMGLRSYLGVPLEARDHILGTLCAFSKNPDAPEEAASLMQAVGQQIGVAIENANLFEQTQQQLADLSTIQETTADLSAALTLDGVVNTLLAHLAAAIRADTSAVFMLDGENLIRVGVYPSGGDDGPEIGETIPLANFPLTQEVIQTQQPLAITTNDPRLQEHARKSFQAAGIAVNATIPIVGIEGVLGTITISRNHPAINFSESELRLVETLASQSSVAILNARSYERVQQVADEMSMLFDVSREISSAPITVEDVAEVVVRSFVSKLSIPECSISLVSHDRNTLRLIADLYIDEEHQEILQNELIGSEIALDEFPATRHVLENLQPLVVQASDPDADPSELAFMKEYETSTLAIFPLAVKGEAIGIIEFEHPDVEHHYSQEELNLAMTLANQAAVALENARLYEEQRQTTEQLLELDQLKSQFLANMSHELRTPLNSIIGFSRVIMKGIDGPVTEQQTQDLSAIYNAGQHLLNMINDILDISKIEAGKMELAFEDVELPQVIESVMATARGLVKDTPVKLITAIDDDLPMIQADPTRIRQILLNLLSNAAKFTEDGSITVTAQQRIGKGDHPEVYLSVIDTGVGIAPEDQVNLFEPFTQVDGSATRKTGGTGLGLSITRLLVDLHGGEIGLTSALGEGSTFYFTIPVSQQEKLAVLAIDNDPQVIDIYQRYLRDTDFKILSMLSYDDILELVRQYQPFVITLDTMLMDYDTWEIFQSIKEDPDTKHIPIIICSIKDEAEKALEMGAADYLPKPILSNDLINALNQIRANRGFEAEPLE